MAIIRLIIIICFIVFTSLFICHCRQCLVCLLVYSLLDYIFIAVGYFTLGKRLGALNIGNVPKDCQDFIDNTQILLEGLQKTVFDPPFYKIYPTKLWKQLLNSQDQVSIILNVVLSTIHL